jgi:hypothetical protein
MRSPAFPVPSRFSLTLTACGEGSAPVRHPAAATAAADPTQACLQLHDFRLHNHGQGSAKPGFGLALAPQHGPPPRIEREGPAASA